MRVHSMAMRNRTTARPENRPMMTASSRKSLLLAQRQFTSPEAQALSNPGQDAARSGTRWRARAVCAGD